MYLERCSFTESAGALAGRLLKLSGVSPSRNDNFGGTPSGAIPDQIIP
jgi:hypothetical protein